MNASQLSAFRKKSQSAREDQRPGTVTYEGTDYDGSVQRGAVQVELEHGPKTLAGMSASIPKTVLATAPQVGKSIVHDGDTFEIYEVAGFLGERWLIRAATFPGDRI